ncbi:WhiB family transcriptional regulator [Rhodococcus tibetensis]|uniref:WhiB family transcriptional regulator n=1 Tax=Rhodococcus tibetensis TaxID=2965064 RepID=A0ABT1QDS8_9NOCA|nr:WhiB family transcriptional regulator [Rhodococcus sp. FXJ9.536]MCQ4120443.1 WhiB family transcriptional regulator [Rhodococcus sp. FXJ9.536]
MPSPTDEQVTETIAELERLGVPVTASRAEAQRSLREADRGASTDRLRAALNARKARAGLTPRNSDASATPKRKAVSALDERVRQRKTIEVLVGLIDPRLRGAACVGRHELFDDRHENEQESDRAARHAAAARICARCPVRTACRDVAAEHSRHIEGVWAGQLQNTTPQAGRSAVHERIARHDHAWFPAAQQRTHEWNRFSCCPPYFPGTHNPGLATLERRHVDRHTPSIAVHAEPEHRAKRSRLDRCLVARCLRPAGAQGAPS